MSLTTNRSIWLLPTMISSPVEPVIEIVSVPDVQVAEGPGRQVERAAGGKIDRHGLGGRGAGDGRRRRYLAGPDLRRVERRRRGTRRVHEGDALDAQEAVHAVIRGGAEIDARAGTRDADLDHIVAGAAIVAVGGGDLIGVADDEAVDLAAADEDFVAGRAHAIEIVSVPEVQPEKVQPDRSTEPPSAALIAMACVELAPVITDCVRDPAGTELRAAQRDGRGARRVDEGEAFDADEAVDAVRGGGTQIDGNARGRRADLKHVVARAAVVAVRAGHLGGVTRRRSGRSGCCRPGFRRRSSQSA